MRQDDLISQIGWEGDGGAGERLIAKIIAGERTAMCSPKAFYAPAQVRALFGRVGRSYTIVDASGKARCVLKQVAVFECPYGEPDERLLKGLRMSRSEFSVAHASVWAGVFEKIGQTLSDETVLLCEVFELVEAAA